MKNFLWFQDLKHAVAFMAVLCASAIFISGCSHETTPVSSRILPTSAYSLSTSDPDEVGPIHNAFLIYLSDSIGSYSAFNLLPVSIQASRFEQLMSRFMLDSTNIDTSGITNIVAVYTSEDSLAQTGTYLSSTAPWQALMDSQITLASLAPDEDSSCRAVIDTLLGETSYSTRMASLTAMQSQWETKWATIDGYGTNGSHDYLLGVLVSIAVNSTYLWRSGGLGGPADGIWAAAADVAGGIFGFATGSGLIGRITNAFKTGAAWSAVVTLLGF